MINVGHHVREDGECNSTYRGSTRRKQDSVELQHRGIVYVQSADYIPENHGRPFDPRDLRTLDVFVNLTKLEIYLKIAAERHRVLGCQVF